MMRNAMGFLVAMLGTSAAFAQAAAPVLKEKKVCVREVATGSMLPKSICHTKAEWAAINAANATNTDAAQERLRDSAPPPSTGGQ